MRVPAAPAPRDAIPAYSLEGESLRAHADRCTALSNNHSGVHPMASSSRKVFCSLAAQITKVHTTTLFTLGGILKAGDPVDPKRLFDLDFALRPEVEMDWSKIKLDDLGSNAAGEVIDPSPDYKSAPNVIHITTIGPTVPPGPLAGAVYIEQGHFEAVVRPLVETDALKWPNTKYPDYGYMSVAYPSDDTDARRRYHGFHANVKARSGRLVRLEIVRDTGASKTIWVDLENPDECDNPSNFDHALKIAPDNDLKEGVVFLALKLCASLQILGPKQPPGGGAW
jgi:hypothetical protein